VRLSRENCLRGEVDFSTEPGQGTVFKVQLPETLEPPAGRRGVSGPLLPFRPAARAAFGRRVKCASAW
jgi:hypothetical protein